jgi:eukaryotic-like serine/threonine-protein kinase
LSVPTSQPDRLATALADRYRIQAGADGRPPLLGQGGMAAVYLAQDLKHDRQVAIKVLRDDLAESLGRSRFLREIRLAAALNHPHILPLYDSGEADGFLYFVMPVMTGQTLRDRLAAERALPVEDAVRIAMEVADALDYAHRHDVVHRDIKPENILLHEGHALVADFGIGKALVAATEASATATQIGVTVGTPAYMSPEQAAGGELDGRSDLFALGCVLYEMLTGEVAFTGPTVQAIIARRFVYSPPRVTEIRSSIPEVVSQTVEQLLAKAPGERPATGAQVVMALRTGEFAAAPPPRDDKSLAVLPFVNRSADAENEYFADGLTEELITDLARVRALRVISRTSSMQLKGTTKGIREVGRELGVRYVLEGSVRRAGNSLRITAQLIDALSDAQLWAEKYSGTMDDVFDVQERVSRAIVDALDVALSPAESRRLADRPIQNVRAFELYLQARQELRRYNLDRGVQLLEQAIAVEGEIPALRALRGAACITRLRMGIDRERALREAEAEGQALLQIAPDTAYGLALLAFVAYERGEHPAAVRSAEAALALDPNDAEVLFYMGVSYQAADQHQRLLETSARLQKADPLSSFTSLLAGIATWFSGRAAEGLPSMERALASDPDSAIIRWTLGYDYAIVGRLADASTHAEWLHQRAPKLPYTIQLRALLAAVGGRKEEALGWLRGVDTESLDAHHTFHLGESFAMAGDPARALELLERAVDNGFYPHDFFAVHCPFLAPLRGTPEFERVLAKAAKRVAEFSA